MAITEIIHNVQFKVTDNEAATALEKLLSQADLLQTKLSEAFKGLGKGQSASELSMVDQNARVAGTLLKDRARYKLDMFDSMRYFLQTYFLEFARRSYFRGVASGVLSV